jgi:hypothetical protein
MCFFSERAKGLHGEGNEFVEVCHTCVLLVVPLLSTQGTQAAPAERDVYEM